MGATTTTTVAHAITERSAPGFINAVWRNNRLLPLLRAIGALSAGREPDPASVFGLGHTWHLNTTGNTSVGSYSEGDPAPAAGNQAWAEAILTWVYHWGFFRITGHAEDALKDGGVFPAGFDTEQTLLAQDLADQVTNTYLGSGANGLLNAIAATGTYANITRGSAAYFEATVETTSEAQSVSRHKSVYRTMRDADKGGVLGLNITTPTQADTYTSIIGSLTTVNYPQTIAMLQSRMGAGAFDVGVIVNGNSLHNAPIVEMPDLTAGTWLYLDIRDVAGWFHDIIRPYRTEWHSNEGDSKKYMTTIGSCLGLENPKLCAKKTNLT